MLIKQTKIIGCEILKYIQNIQKRQIKNIETIAEEFRLWI